MELHKLALLLGLPADASCEQMDERITELLAKGRRVAASKPLAPPGMTLIPEAALDKLRRDAAEGEAAWALVEARTRDRVIGEAIQAGRFPFGLRETYLRLWDVDPQGTRASIEAMPPGTVPREYRPKT
jgi:hypothetical protein